MSNGIDRIIRANAGTDQTPGEVLDVGRGVDSESLRLRGDYIYWTRSGKRRRALLK
jgi:hypothetical protein